ncbi:MAG: SDR family oxidoreductase [Chlamydiae bacterium]|nr:SDR family oxidoreductase [Chlamydiota bacterium]
MNRFLIAFLFILSAVSLIADSQNSLKVVLVTGASRGIGFESAKHLSENGYLVYAGVRNLDSVANLTDSNIRFEVLDVTDAASIKKAVNTIIQKEGRIDILINNAGYALGGPLECLTIEEMQKEMDVNFFGVIRVCQEVLPYMRKQKSGHIINISSEQGVYGLPYGSLYTSSKAAIESLSEALSIEVLPWDIRVSIVEPGMVATNFFVALGSKQLQDDPYQNILELINTQIKEKRVVSENCQAPENIALLLQNVIEDPNPKLRYQSSKRVEEIVSECLKDITGNEYTKKMRKEYSDLTKDNR